ncbi:hypothetical protein [Geminocystis sp. GBBB08]|uniref:hypothetical protein n=1 Tax=Geminocystis sp. GBBB08 TaxID=2604140 RepID=UPI0027E3ABE2|nr:hypothetical protein [Geminocystis sp. GBBB08]MBL1210391.1 hypothetical protein [Geminocystis sp. GBBB08]
MSEIFTNIDPNLVFSLMLLHCLIGLTAGIIADSKGYFFSLWLLIGIMGGTFALIASINLKSKNAHKIGLINSQEVEDKIKLG